MSETFPSGEYKHIDLSSVPSSYLRKMVGRVDDEDLRAAIEEELSYRTDHHTHFENNDR